MGIRKRRVGRSGGGGKRSKKSLQKKFITPRVEGSLPQVQDAWNCKDSIQDNYKRLGLCLDVNATLKKRISFPQAALDLELVDACNNESQVGEEARGELSELLEEFQNLPPKTSREPTSMPIQEQILLKALVAKYDDNYEAMARDITRNPWQKTARQLEKRLTLYHRFNNSPNVSS